MKKLVFLLVSVVLIASCKNQGEKSSQNVKQSEFDEFVAKANEIRPRANKPSDIQVFFEMTGSDYIPGVVNDPLNYEQYLEVPDLAAANLAVYLVDAFYLLAYDKWSEAYNSIAAARSIAYSMNLDDLFVDVVLDRLEEGYEPDDSLRYKIDQVLVEAENDFNESDRMQFFSALLIGDYLETQYILFKTLMEYPVDLPDQAKLLILREVIFMMKNELQSLDYIIELFEKYHTDESRPGILGKELKLLREKYRALNLEPAKLTPSDIFDNPLVEEMYEHVQAARDVLVNPVI